MSFKLVSGAHSLGEANIHFQFTPKYRRDIFRDEGVKRACEACLRRIAEDLGVVLHAVEFGPDHCHLFVGACKNFSVAELAQRFKGASSRDDPTGDVGYGEREAVGRRLLEHRLLLPQRRIHNQRRHRMVHRTCTT